MTERRFVVCYDTPDDRRRAAFSRLLGGWGERVQWSVFECRLQPAELTRMLRALQAAMVEEEDSVLVYQCGAGGMPAHAAMARRPDLQTDFWLV